MWNRVNREWMEGWGSCSKECARGGFVGSFGEGGLRLGFRGVWVWLVLLERQY